MCCKKQDTARLARYRKNPALGPNILFFSGGSALRAVSRQLIAYTYNSVHIITPFDSGGSSAGLRNAFAMPAVGDIRNRLIALADPDFPGNEAVRELFAYRLARLEKKDRLRALLLDLVHGRHPKMCALPAAMQEIVSHHLGVFYQQMPEDFDLSGASIGNLILAGGYLENQRDLNSVISFYSRLAWVRGHIRPVVQGNYHLGAVLTNGQMVIGQHLLTGKQSEQIASPIQSIFLTHGLDCPEPCTAPADEGISELIAQADLICFPMGSLFTSVLANILPQGVAESIQKARCPKVFVPNTFYDPESFGLSLQDQIRILLNVLQTRTGSPCGLDYVLMDTLVERYPGEISLNEIRSMGVDVLSRQLVTPKTAPGIAPERLVQALLCLG